MRAETGWPGVTGGGEGAKPRISWPEVHSAWSSAVALRSWTGLAQRRFEGYDFGARWGQRHEVAPHGCAIRFERNLVAVSGALHFDVISDATEFAGSLEAAPAFRDDRRDQQAIIGRANAKNPLCDRVVVPGGRACEPGVLGFSKRGSVTPGDHLGVHVGLAAVDVADLLASGRINPRVIVVGAVSITDARFADDDPRIVVTEDACVFLVARRVRGDLAEFEVILRVSRLLQNDAMFGGEQLARGFEGSHRESILDADAGEGTEPLRFNEDLALCIFLGADLAAEIVVGTDKPLAIPSMLANRGFHLGYLRQVSGSLGSEAAMLGDIREFAAGEHKQGGNE